jgi:endonuclease/exonuclease/phosphatase (EEP) superfamily protein YafD
MNQFKNVYDFHKLRFAESKTIPTFFGGDFNTVPHLDGGPSPASKILIDAGFTDTYRDKHPDVKNFPGYTHEDGVRIDQLYYKGANVTHDSTQIISKWKTGFPSDHYMILSKFHIHPVISMTPPSIKCGGS